MEVAGSSPAGGILIREEAMEEKKLEEGTFIVSTSEMGTITGEICGIVTTEMPGIGYIYIIKIMARTGKAWSKYPYSCCTLPRSMFKVAYMDDTQEVTITADDKYQIKGQCAGCHFVAAKCANDDETDCPYFAPEEK